MINISIQDNSNIHLNMTKNVEKLSKESELLLLQHNYAKNESLITFKVIEKTLICLTIEYEVNSLKNVDISKLNLIIRDIEDGSNGAKIEINKRLNNVNIKKINTSIISSFSYDDKKNIYVLLKLLEDHLLVYKIYKSGKEIKFLRIFNKKTKEEDGCFLIGTYNNLEYVFLMKPSNIFKFLMIKNDKVIDERRKINNGELKLDKFITVENCDKILFFESERNEFFVLNKNYSGDSGREKEDFLLMETIKLN